MNYALVADIGGTTSRLALAGPGGRPESLLRFDNDAIAGPEAAIASFLEQTGARPRIAVLAVAGAVGAEEIALTNRSWRVRPADIARRFEIERVRAINDFEAVAWSVPGLRDGDVRKLGRPEARTEGPRVVFGPGTGLGVAALLPSRGGWGVLCSEGGHVSFGPAQADEGPLFERVRKAHGFVSAETLLSGPGICRLHQALHCSDEALPAAAIVSAANANEPEALATARLFVRLLGRFAGDLALLFRAGGGVFVAGGIARRLAPVFDDNLFRSAFEAHPPHANLLREIPTSLITADEPGLLGCAVVADQLRADPGA